MSSLIFLLSALSALLILPALCQGWQADVVERLVLLMAIGLLFWACSSVEEPEGHPGGCTCPQCFRVLRPRS